MRIPLAPTPAMGHYNALVLVLKIPQHLVSVRVLTDRPHWHTNNPLLATFAMHVLAFAMRTAPGKVQGMVVEI
jgi:hypothetical protein